MSETIKEDFNTSNDKTLLNFITKTKNGDYGFINKDFSDYKRILEETDENYTDEVYFYSIR